MDLNSQARGDEAASTPVRVNQLKTAAYSVERPLHLGASLAGASDQVTSGLRTYGTAIGCAYQLRDDLLDLYGDPERTGKPRGGDLREGKRPLILALGLRSARERGGPAAVATLRAAIGEPGLTDVDVRVVADLLVELGAKDDVERRLYSLIQEAKRSLATTPIAASARQELSRLADLATSRTR
nr:polyprenyl synthetase family protein [Spiractinospora alimapuensis]